MQMKTLAVIPARSGSKSFPDKNIRDFLGKPLLAHSVEQALAASSVHRVIVSTDSEAYATLAKSWGAEVPFLRPAEISGDLSTDYQVFRHALEWLAEKENYIPDICVHLRPTYPVRRIQDIDAIVDILRNHPEIDSVRSISPAPETPYKMWFSDDNGLITPVCTASGIPEAHSMPRQILPKVFLHNGSIDAFRADVVLKHGSMVGKRVYGYLMKENFDIDDFAQFAVAEHAGLANTDSLSLEAKTFCFDIDGVIATIVPNNDYSKSQPRREMISHINILYDQGHKIIIHTARGVTTGTDWSEMTRKQLAEWGLRYHELYFGKPAADFYIDDKILRLDEVSVLANDKFSL